MVEKIDDAIRKMAERVAATPQADQALKFSQSALNMAHAKQIIEQSPKKRASA